MTMPTPVQAILWFGLILVLLAIYVLWKAQNSKDNPVDIAYLLIDTQTGQTSLKKAGEAIAMLVTTWIVVYLTVADRLTETYFFAYIAVWVTRALLGSIVAAKFGTMPPPKEKSDVLTEKTGRMP